jgi:hypothetical protein
MYALVFVAFAVHSSTLFQSILFPLLFFNTLTFIIISFFPLQRRLPWREICSKYEGCWRSWELKWLLLLHGWLTVTPTCTKEVLTAPANCVGSTLSTQEYVEYRHVTDTMSVKALSQDWLYILASLVHTYGCDTCACTSSWTHVLARAPAQRWVEH